MRTNIRGTSLPAAIIGGTGYADLGAVVDALGLAELVMRLNGIPIIAGADGRPLVGLRRLTERAELPHQYDRDSDTFYIDAQPPPLPDLPAEPVGAGVQPWLPVTPVITGGPGDRNPALLERILRQFRVAENPRYRANQQGKGETYCNIYTWDATRALGAEIPHWVGAQGVLVGPGQGGELDANRTITWLRTYGPNYGWRHVSEMLARLEANAGKPVVASWYNPGGIGHVAMVRPGPADPVKGPPIAQAGARNFDDGFLADGFGSKSPIEYWTHD